MAQQMEVGGLALQIPSTPEELMQHMEHRSQLGGTPGDLGDYTRAALELGQGGLLISAADDGEDWGIFPAITQTPAYTLAVFEGLGHNKDNPLVKWGIEARYARTQLLRRTGAALVSICDERILQPNEAIGAELFARQLEATIEATEDQSVTVHLTTQEALAGLGVRELSLILPNGPSTPTEAVSAFAAVDHRLTARQPASAVPGLVERMHGVLTHSQTLSAAASRQQIIQTFARL